MLLPHRGVGVEEFSVSEFCSISEFQLCANLFHFSGEKALMTDTCEWMTIAGGRRTLTLTATEIALMDEALQAQKLSLVQKVKQQFISVTSERLDK